MRIIRTFEDFNEASIQDKLNYLKEKGFANKKNFIYYEKELCKEKIQEMRDLLCKWNSKKEIGSFEYTTQSLYGDNLKISVEYCIYSSKFLITVQTIDVACHELILIREEHEKELLDFITK